MVKKLLLYSFVFAISLCAPATAGAAELDWNAPEMVEDHNIGIAVNQSTLHVTGASGMTLEVVSLTGRPVASIKIESPSQRVELNLPKGCYILKIGKLVRKVSIR